ncbi:DUF5719 family protein [Janibacter melonis]|uniref:DUF5719 family protein n=1 Tax=Janibacter melonis TaxID=262209 RepID=UPI00191B4831|nr:DUF5719 family protein [Janibacter melonis]
MKPLRLVLVAVLAGGTVAGAQAATRPEPTGPSGAAPRASVPATQAELVCPGSPLAGVDGVEDVRTSGVVAGQVAPDDLVRRRVRPPDEQGRLQVSPLGGGETDRPVERDRVARGGSLAQGATITGTGDHAPGLVGAEEVVASNDQVRGASTAPCAVTSADQWLVAGGSGAGRQERLLVSNPGENPVSVDVTGLGERRTQTPPAGQDVTVPPRSRVALLLDGITGASASQVVRVRATGGPVAAWVVDHWVDGLEPRGLEVVPATGDPSRQQVLGAISKGESARVVVGAPGNRDAVVKVRAVGSDRARSVAVATVPAGTSRSVDVDVESGVVAYTVTSDEPVVAAAEVVGSPSRTGGQDMSWSTATPAVRDLVGAVVPNAVAGLPRHVQLTAPSGAAEAEVVSVYAGEATTRTVSLERDRSTVVPLEDVDAVWVRRVSGDVHASLLTKGETGPGTPVLSVTPLLRARVADRTVEVLPVP